MREIFVISDTHFGHAAIINYCKRPFTSVEEMNEFMVKQWNETVKDEDIVYHLGDVYFGPATGKDILPRLRGRKRLLLGNHDDGKDILLHKTFQKIGLWRMFREMGVLLTHVPIHETSLQDLVNVHGHIHNNQPTPSSRHFNVSVEMINYTPVSIETFRIR